METQFKAACQSFIEAWAESDQDATTFAKMDGQFKAKLDQMLAELGWTGGPLPTIPTE